jgi:hypothetical protein
MSKFAIARLAISPLAAAALSDIDKKNTHRRHQTCQNERGG